MEKNKSTRGNGKPFPLPFRKDGAAEDGRFRGAIFDMDGTILDSMGMWKVIDREYLARFGKEAPADLQRRIEGFSVPETARYFKDTFGIPDSTEEIVAAWNEMAREEYLYRLQLKPGAEAYLRRLRGEGVKLGIATTNYRDLTEACLRRLGILDLFDAVVTSGEIEKGKPDPEIFLKAAEAMGVRPADCAVFEDLPAGLLAGKRAGMRTAAVWDAASASVDAEKRAMADAYAASWEEWMKETAEDLPESENDVSIQESEL